MTTGMKRLGVIALLALVTVQVPAAAQALAPEIVRPSEQALQAARAMVNKLFKDLKKGKTQEIAEMLVEQVGLAWDTAKKIQNRSEYQSKLEVMLVGPPDGSYGKLHGFDLIEEGYLPGTSRYFRLTYITYHDVTPLLWEFRFYVRPDGKVALNSFAWSEQNPFEYLTTSDMLLGQLYAR